MEMLLVAVKDVKEELEKQHRKLMEELTYFNRESGEIISDVALFHDEESEVFVGDLPEDDLEKVQVDIVGNMRSVTMLAEKIRIACQVVKKL